MISDPEHIPANSILACPTVEMVEVPAPGAAKTKCGQCGHEVWIGTRQQVAKAKNPDVSVMCFGCAATEHVKRKACEPPDVHSFGGTSHYYGPN